MRRAASWCYLLPAGRGRAAGQWRARGWLAAAERGRASGLQLLVQGCALADAQMRFFAQPHYSFSPEEGGGSGRAPSSCSSFARLSSCSLLLLRVHAPRPALLGREHPSRLRSGPFLYPLRMQLPLCVWLEQTPKPPQFPEMVVWRYGWIRWWSEETVDEARYELGNMHG